ncbi:MAG: hypothetical protein ABI383_10165 [Acidobacteriaceae bacterium]
MIEAKKSRGLLRKLFGASLVVADAGAVILGKPDVEERIPKHSQMATEADAPLPADWQHQSGWTKAKPERLPRPTYAPAMMAFGIVFLALGLITRWYVSAVGGCAFAVSIWLWVGELRNDSD